MPQDRGIVLYDYWRSSASYRVRIALGLLSLNHHVRTVDLLKSEHRAADYLALNPQGVVPTLLIDGQVMTQSLAILEYLHATVPRSSLLPEDPLDAVRVRQIAYAIAMEIHPVCNLSVAARVVELAGGGDETRVAWMQEFIGKGLRAVEMLFSKNPGGPFCVGNAPTMADCCLVPQLYNARRWGVPLDGLDRIEAVARACDTLEAFRNTHPDRIKADHGPH